MEADEQKENNVTVSLSHSYESLTAEAQARFRALGVLAVDASFDKALLAALWAIPVETVDEAADPLRHLGLIEFADGTYTQHAVLRAYARALLTQMGEMEAVSQLYFAYFAALHGAIRDHTDPDYLRSITSDLSHLQAILNWGFDHTPQAACDLIGILNNYFRVYQTTQVYRSLLESALIAAEKINYRPGLANTLKALGDLSVRLAALKEARAFYDRAVTLYEAVESRLGLANLFTSLGDMCVSQKQWAEAIMYYNKALPLAVEIDARLTIANILVDLGRAKFESGDQTGGMADMRQAADLFEAVQNPQWAQIAHQRLQDMEQRAGGETTTPTSQDQAAQVMRQLAALYQQQGADAVRQMLRGQVPDEVIEQLLAQLAALPSQAAPAVSTLPAETVQMLASNTFAVKTSHANKLAEWTATLTGQRVGWAGQGNDWDNEVAFADALLAILADQPVTMPADNPYADVVQQVIAAIAKYNSESS